MTRCKEIGSLAMLFVLGCETHPGAGTFSGGGSGDDAAGVSEPDGAGNVAAGGGDADSSSGAGPAARSTASPGAGGADGSSATSPDTADAARDAPGVGDANVPGAGDAADALDAVRQACVDTINMYRATVGLGALAEAPASTEACSDRGAMQDATNNSPHSSAGMCPNTGGQDTCPDLPVGGPGETLISSLQECLAEMWAEGPPPSGTTVAQCIQDYSGCFLQHGHYINMSAPGYAWVSCGFFMMSSSAYWANQDFGPLSGSP